MDPKILQKHLIDLEQPPASHERALLPIPLVLCTLVKANIMGPRNGHRKAADPDEEPDEDPQPMSPNTLRAHEMMAIMEASIFILYQTPH
jgi:hypothetical protein